MAETPSPSKYNPLGQAEVGPAALLAQACSVISFLLSTQMYEAPWLFCCLRSFLWTPLPRMCLEGASPNDRNAWLHLELNHGASHDFSSRARDMVLPCVSHITGSLLNTMD